MPRHHRVGSPALNGYGRLADVMAFVRKGRQWVVAAGLTLSLLALAGEVQLGGGVSTADASQIPAVVADPAICLAVCKLAVEPKVWSPVVDGSWYMANIHWSSWGGERTQGTATINFRSCWGNCFKFTSFSADVSFFFPVTWGGHLVYAGYSASPSNPQVGLTEENNRLYVVVSGLAL
jgi:hypothetical protein